MRSFQCAILVISLSIGLFASAAGQQYDPYQAFAPGFYVQQGNSYRSADGAPGPHYWQNRADYRVVASFDTATRRLAGEVQIHYVNNSPDTLYFLWLELDQNYDRGNMLQQWERGHALPLDTSVGFNIYRVETVGATVLPLHYMVWGTRMQVWLPKPLLPHQDLHLQIAYAYHLLPHSGGDRSGYLDTRRGRIFEFSYWYPRMCVYDDLHGWNTLPFLGEGEFYMDYGNIDYTVTVPANMLVVGSGSCVNAEEILDEAVLNRLRQAHQSNTTVMVYRPGERLTRAQHGRVSWHFRMGNTRDVAWALSSAFMWDAARINLPGNKQALAMSVYPEESAGDSAWGRATEYLKGAVEIFSQQWFPYPYPVAINVAGPVGGMEFPGITFDDWQEKGKNLWALLAHEIGHNWFPMIVGSDERRNAWMDEGFNTFIDVYASEIFHHGEYAPKRDGEYAPHGGNPAEELIPYIKGADVPPIMTHADLIPPRYLHPLEYFKTAYGLVLLRELILGHARFDSAFRAYIHRWAFKHPSPNDFFRTMENVSGEDLSWFWRGWFQHNWQLDQAISRVTYVDQDRTKGVLLTLENKQQMVMPVMLKLSLQNGDTLRYRLPVEIWQRGAIYGVKLPTHVPIQQIEIDPDHILPDVDRSNNVWKAAQG
ncbi:MAG: M1 family metallopeptidase [Thermoflavifilum sp.]|nr:M1 family metallopeptidase [Thermoflavifilum sp.]